MGIESRESSGRGGVGGAEEDEDSDIFDGLYLSLSVAGYGMSSKLNIFAPEAPLDESGVKS